MDNIVSLKECKNKEKFSEYEWILDPMLAKIIPISLIPIRICFFELINKLFEKISNLIKK